ncbi:MAG: 2-C-methyl-D-erythritol 4-phosphate cytidylyltransferase [bacterium]
MADTGRVCALIPAAGRGARFGATRNKVLTELGGRPILGWTLEAFARCHVIEAIILVGQFEELPLLHAIAAEFGGGKVTAVVAGGEDRQESVRNGLAACDGFDFVAIHDAARCGITPEVISRTVNLAQEKNASSVAALPITDTLASENPDAPGAVSGYIPRDHLRAIQTPQVFPVPLIRAAHDVALAEKLTVSDDTQLIRRLGEPVYFALGSPRNCKVTHAEDATLMAIALRESE